MTRVLFVGQQPETVDFTNPILPPGMNAERIHAGITLALKQMAERGWHADLCLLRPEGTSASTGCIGSRPVRTSGGTSSACSANTAIRLTCRMPRSRTSCSRPKRRQRNGRRKIPFWPSPDMRGRDGTGTLDHNEDLCAAGALQQFRFAESAAFRCFLMRRYKKVQLNHGVQQ
jgi:hypothetical protein